jgi:GNAT superfamily N-acetyltransferase
MTNLERMIALADEFFDARSDPEQILVNDDVMAKLRQIHPATMGEVREGDGPVAWMLVIPTSHEVMERFLRADINEGTLLAATHPGERYDALYLCSALVLPEFRGRGIARRLALDAVAAIRADHPITTLFYWAFSPEGKQLAESIGRETGLSLLARV